MGHNWVLSTTPDFQGVARPGKAAGRPNFCRRAIRSCFASTTVVGGGQETSVKVDMSGLTAGSDYTYFCSFPGHFVLMSGKFIVE